MDSESIYTDNEITQVAEKVAEFILNANGILGQLIFESRQHLGGPLAMFVMWSHKYNPLGEFKIEAETLTMAQKGIIVRIVGDLMTKLDTDE